ncbi:MAG: nitroreductase family deazaflavin-dependent oxidoreductase [Spirochaetaceae bacterium]|nr:nitroreductase family deazaflavin-dependent oxidoreductase [Myxococcales bacterium]MCB9723891.1 nitroreductase family deazaflavin-dependent oxidoreductase [Spirochaetaceae bacterium]HPG27472.1 nitroreductase/quinone reductase family protein [Myxococcota bacterium]
MLDRLKRLAGGRGTRLAAVLWIGKSVAIVAVGALVACGPIGPIPGGALSGEAGPRAVADWSVAASEARAQLETRPDDPRSVNTWFVSVGPRLYVPTSMILGPKHPDGRSWVAHVAADPRVRIRLGDTVYERRAVRVEDPAEYAAAREALEAKYAIAPADRDPDRTIWIYRLDERKG